MKCKCCVWKPHPPPLSGPVKGQSHWGTGIFLEKDNSLSLIDHVSSLNTYCSHRKMNSTRCYVGTQEFSNFFNTLHSCRRSGDWTDGPGQPNKLRFSIHVVFSCPLRCVAVFVDESYNTSGARLLTNTANHLTPLGIAFLRNWMKGANGPDGPNSAADILAFKTSRLCPE